MSCWAGNGLSKNTAAKKKARSNLQRSSFWRFALAH
jgi:hypothetical protein